MKTPIAYYGGKQKLVPEILPLIPEHIQYVEPFTGGGAVFFAKKPSKNEVLNDLDGRVTNFYRVAQTEFYQLQKLIQGTAHSEIEYKRAAEILKGENKSPIDYAWAFWVQTQFTFGHKIYSGFRFSETGEGKNTANKRDAFTEAYLYRLREVEILQRNALEVIKLKDSPNTFFYIDPPYVSSNCGHYEGYTMENFIELLTVLTTIEGKFLLSSYPEDSLLDFRKVWEWNTQDTEHVLQVTGKREETKYKTECLTWNYELKKEQLLFDF
jgi:DNA adenine methylase